VNATEGVPFALTVQATDLDGDPLLWSDDSPMFAIGPSDGTISFLPSQGDVGRHRVTVTATDGHGGVVTVAFDLVVVNVNDPPVIGDVNPLSGTSFKEGEPVSFTASATDKDRDSLTFIWREGSRELGRGSPFTTSGLKPGRHAVTLVVDDGNTTVERQLEVVVREAKGGIGTIAIALIAVVVVVVLVVVVALVVRARGRARVGVEEAPSTAGSSAAAGTPADKAPEAEEPPKIEIEYREV
jgi:hypothetical protein